jgi:hypothetical protein
MTNFAVEGRIVYRIQLRLGPEQAPDQECADRFILNAVIEAPISRYLTRKITLYHFHVGDDHSPCPLYVGKRLTGARSGFERQQFRIRPETEDFQLKISPAFEIPKMSFSVCRFALLERVE